MMKNTKINFKALLATTLLLFSAMSMPISPVFSTESTTLYISPQNSYPFVEESFTVSVKISNVTNLNGWQVRLTFDPPVLNCTRAEVPPDNIFSSYSPYIPPPEINNTEGYIYIAAFLFEQGLGVNGSGTLFQLEFKSKTEGTSALNFIDLMQPQGTLLLDPDATLIPFEAINGFVEVSGSEKLLSVPFHFQDESYYSGPASLEMVFDFYGEDISQLEIAEVARSFPNVTYADELRRAGHFSNKSTSMGTEMPENITGYSLRKIGYGTFEKTGLTLFQLKDAVRSGYPIIVSTWYNLSMANSQYRVVVGYNSTHIMAHDPWNKAAWGGTFGGPNVALNYSTFLTLWNQSNYWGLFVHPWKVTITFKMLDIQPYLFNVTANIQYASTEAFANIAYSASLAHATIILSAELNLSVGENATKTLAEGNLAPGVSVNLNWLVESNTTGKYNLTVDAMGKISGNVSSHGVYPEYSYQDVIGGKDLITVWLGGVSSSPYPGDINGDGKVDIKDIARAAKAFGSYPGDPRWDPVADVTGSSGVPDGRVDIRDIAFIAKNYGAQY